MLTDTIEPLSKIESKHREQFNPNVSRVRALQCAVAFKPVVVLFLQQLVNPNWFNEIIWRKQKVSRLCGSTGSLLTLCYYENRFNFSAGLKLVLAKVDHFNHTC